MAEEYLNKYFQSSTFLPASDSEQLVILFSWLNKLFDQYYPQQTAATARLAIILEIFFLTVGDYQNNMSKCASLKLIQLQSLQKREVSHLYETQ